MSAVRSTWTVLAVVAALLGLAAPAQADRNFSQRYSRTQIGDIQTIGNTLMTCPVLNLQCGTAQAGNNTTPANNANNAFNMAYVDSDLDLSTVDSSSSTLALPANATVTFAGLYYEGRTGAATIPTATQQAVSFKVPGASSYASLIGTVDTVAPLQGSAGASDVFYQGFVNVTSQVAAAGNGVYQVGNVESETNVPDRSAGWALVVAYSTPTGTRHSLQVYDGYVPVFTSNPQTVSLNGLLTPSSGTVNSTVGIIANEGDLQNTGDSFAINGTGISNGLNPASDVFNSTISRNGVRFATKTPDYVNQLGFDVDTFSTTALTAGTSTASLAFTSTGDQYLPGAVTIVADADSTPPVTTLLAGTGPAAGGSTANATPTFAFSSNEAGSTFECSTDGTNYTACTSPYTTPTLADGTYTFSVRAIDPAGNVDPTPATRTFTVDTAAPDTGFSNATGPAAGGSTSNSTPTFTFTSTETGVTYECAIATGSTAPTSGFSLCANPYTTPTQTDGTYTIAVRSRDAAGNVDASPASRTYTVDTAAPNTTITNATGPADGGSTSNATPTFTFSSNETGVTYECNLNPGSTAGTTFTPCTNPMTTATLAQGTYTLSVRARDAAGNVDATPATRTFTVDTTAPDTAITNATGPAAGGSTNNNRPTFTFSSPEAGVTYECAIATGTAAPTSGFSACANPFTVATQADGTYTIAVRARDAAGNLDATPATRTYTVDTAAPDGVINTGVADGGTTTSGTPTFTFSGAGAGGTYQCKIDSGTFVACNGGTFTPSPALTDGSHTFTVVATDAAGNVDPTPAVRTFVVDGTPPNTAITAPANNATVGTATPTITSTSTELNSTFQCKVDGGVFVACSASFTTPALSAGSHTVAVFATDAAGNADPTPATVTFTVDLTLPDTTITAGPATGSSINTTTPAFSFTGTKAGSTFQCAVDGAAFTTCASPITLAALGEGSHTFAVRAIDALGNVDASPATRTFTVDTTPPDTDVTSGPNGPTNNTTPTWAFTSPGTAGATFQCRVDGGAFSACTSPFTPGAPLAEGTHTFEVRAIDAAGNVDPTPVLLTISVDTTAPDTSITTKPADPATDRNPTFGFTSPDGTATFQCRIDGGTYQSCSAPKQFGPLADGQHTFDVRAIDLAGNIDPTPSSYTFKVDATPPDTTITGGPADDAVSRDPKPTWTFTSDEPGTFECKIDSGAFVPCTSPFTPLSLADGKHTFTVRAIDAAGNVDQTPVVRTITIDTSAPDTASVSGPDSPASDPTPTFEFNAPGTPGATFECRVDGGDYKPCTSPFVAGPLPDGTHTVDVRAIDAAGNVDPTPLTYTIVIETTEPDTGVTGPTGTINDTTPTFTLTSTKTKVTFECRLDGGAWKACTSPFTTDALADGKHTLDVRATDTLGHTDSSPATISFTVSTAAVTPTPSPTATASPAPTVTPTSTPSVPDTGAEDLGTIPGSLVAANRCQLLGGTGRVLSRRPAGFGRVRVRLQGNASAPPGTPLYVTVLGSKTKLAGVSYSLDKTAIAASRARPFRLTMSPAALSKTSKHLVLVTLRSRAGKTKTLKLRFKSLRCNAALTVSQSRRARGSLLRLRIDSLRSLSTVAFGVPALTLSKGSVATLRIRTSGAAAKRYTLKKQGSTFVGTTAPVVVKFTRTAATIAGLPAKAGIVRLNVRTAAKPIGSAGRAHTMRARIVSAGKAIQLKAKLRAKKVA